MGQTLSVTKKDRALVKNQVCEQSDSMTDIILLQTLLYDRHYGTKDIILLLLLLLSLLLLLLRHPQNQTKYDYEKLNLTIMVKC